MSYSVEVLRKDAAFVPEVRSPTVRRRELGALLRALRNQNGLTVDQVAERLLCSPSKVSRMETGHGAATPRDIRDLCDLYGVTDEAERERMMRLAHESKQQGWWHSHDLDFGTYVGLEEDAVATRYYQSTIVPGVLQTADYARAVHEVVLPRLLPDRIEELVEVRMIRQRRLDPRQPSSFHSSSRRGSPAPDGRGTPGHGSAARQDPGDVSSAEHHGTDSSVPTRGASGDGEQLHHRRAPAPDSWRRVRRRTDRVSLP